jgi:hypothetical protein
VSAGGHQYQGGCLRLLAVRQQHAHLANSGDIEGGISTRRVLGSQAARLAGSAAAQAAAWVC